MEAKGEGLVAPESEAWGETLAGELGEGVLEGE